MIDAGRQQSYADYLKSEQWQQLRLKVLQRDGFRCQGCLAARATQVHHRSYGHVRGEFCFELISLCDACHERLHGRSK